MNYMQQIREWEEKGYSVRITTAHQIYKKQLITLRGIYRKLGFFEGCEIRTLERQVMEECGELERAIKFAKEIL